MIDLRYRDRITGTASFIYVYVRVNWEARNVAHELRISKNNGKHSWTLLRQHLMKNGSWHCRPMSHWVRIILDILIIFLRRTINKSIFYATWRGTTGKINNRFRVCTSERSRSRVIHMVEQFVIRYFISAPCGNAYKNCDRNT